MPEAPLPSALPASARRWGPLAIAAAVPALLFFALPPLTRSGLWDPYELDVADLSRRIALHLYGAGSLALDGANNTLPHLDDLGRPQLAFSSIALGFKLFGLHAWAGRLPLALWGLLGVLATYAFVARLFDRRAGVYAAVALSTMPLYFVQARTMLGDICTMAGLAMAFGGLAVAAFDRDAAGPTALRERWPWLGMAAIGLLVGFESRGGMLGLGVPLLGVGLAWGVGRVATSMRARDRAGDVVGGAALAAGIVVAGMGVRAVARGGSHGLDMWLGAIPHLPAKYPTFDFTLAAVGHALAPWSAFLPFAFGRLLLAPHGRAGGEAERESLGRTAILVGAAVALVVHGYLCATTDRVAFTGACLCAVACAIALRDFERGAHASIAVGLGTLVLAAVLHHDFHELPEKAYTAFGVSGAAFPEGFKAASLGLWWLVLGGFGLTAFLTWAERDAKRTPFDPQTYLRVLRTLREAYDGTLPLAYLAAVAGAALAGLYVLVGARTHAHWLPVMSSTLRDLLLNAWWFLALVPLGAVFALLLVCDAWLWAFGRGRRPHRATAMVLGGGVTGLVLCLFYYPALANQLSPKEVFESYGAMCPGAPLALLGVGGRTAAYYAGGQPTAWNDPAAAFAWLTAGAGERRCLAMKADELPRLNALWRERSAAPHTNLPVLDARSSQILLASSTLAPGDRNDNPLGAIVLSSMPRTQRPLGVNLDDKLEIAGLDLVDERGRLVDAVSPGRTYRIKTYYRVLAPVGTEWPNAFVHIDGSGRRHGADHKPLGGKYPMGLWQPGDVVVDDAEFRLEPNFTPGNYTIYFGLAVGDRCSERMAVKSGPSDGCNRVNAGPLRVQ